MKKVAFFVMFFLTCCLMSVVAFAQPSFDKSNTSKGILGVTYDGGLTKKIRLTVEMAGNTNKYQYIINTNKQISIPLQLGNGEYSVKLLENVSGNSYRVIAQDKFSATITSPNDMFLVTSPIVNYAADMKAIKGYNELLKSKTTKNDKITTTYEDVVTKYVYDTEKAKNPPADYVPVIDAIYDSKKAICYDYSVMMASVLRSQGIPVKLVMGYAPEIKEYHAWNEIYMDNKWVVVDTTYDSAYAHANQNYSMVKDGSKFKVVKVY